MRRHHPAQRGQGAALAAGGRLHPALDAAGRGLGPQHHLRDVHQVQPQRVEVDARPVGRRVGLQQADDLLQRGEGVLAGQAGQRSGAGSGRGAPCACPCIGAGWATAPPASRQRPRRKGFGDMTGSGIESRILHRRRSGCRPAGQPTGMAGRSPRTALTGDDPPMHRRHLVPACLLVLAGFNGSGAHGAGDPAARLAR